MGKGYLSLKGKNQVKRPLTVDATCKNYGILTSTGKICEKSLTETPNGKWNA